MSASGQIVTILTPHGRREVVKVTPSTLLSTALDTVCSKHGFNSIEYCLKLQTNMRTNIDITIPFRLTGLPNRCTLEMQKLQSSQSAKVATSTVDVAIQLASGKRLMLNSVSAENCLYSLLEQLQKDYPDEHLLNPDPSTSDVFGKEPSLSFMGSSFVGVSLLKSKTLRSSGASSGRILMRHSFDFPTENESMQSNLPLSSLPADTSTSFSVVANEIEPPTNKRSFTTSNDFQPMRNVADTMPSQMQAFSWMPDFDPSSMQPSTSASDNRPPIEENQHPNRFANFKFPEQNNNQSVVNSDRVATRVNYPTELKNREETVFDLNDLNIQASIEDVPESFFDITVDDLKKMQKLRAKEVDAFNNKPLMTEKLKKSQVISKYGNITSIRFLFPDRSVIQAKFLLTETTDKLYSFLREHLHISSPKCAYKLFSSPPKVNIPNSSKSTLLDLGLYPAVNVYFSSDELSAPFLCPATMALRKDAAEVLMSSTSSPVPDAVQSQATFSGRNTLGYESRGQSHINNNFSTSASSKIATTDPDKLPKWFQKGIKK